MDHTDTTEPEAPNHHADHPGFSGAFGVVAALSMAFGRDDTADVARELAGIGPTDRLVDIGCGPGVAARRAAAAGTTVIGVDPATIMLRVARLRDVRHRVRFLEGRAEHLPVEDNWATVAWTLASVHHWPDVNAGIAEARRVLAPGGRFIAIERRIEDTAATGLASHGWTTGQAATFARLCNDTGFVDADVTVQNVRHGQLLAVIARTPNRPHDQTGVE
jgi:ubiquinone/menaquinone biosynthesis C-methylase UbiE